MPGACPPWDPILLFLHTYSPKSNHIRGPRPLMGARPPLGNPGSATGNHHTAVYADSNNNSQSTSSWTQVRVFSLTLRVLFR